MCIVTSFTLHTVLWVTRTDRQTPHIFIFLFMENKNQHRLYWKLVVQGQKIKINQPLKTNPPHPTRLPPSPKHTRSHTHSLKKNKKLLIKARLHPLLHPLSSHSDHFLIHHQDKNREKIWPILNSQYLVSFRKTRNHNFLHTQNHSHQVKKAPKVILINCKSCQFESLCLLGWGYSIVTDFERKKILKF